MSFINEADGIANADQLAWTIGTRLRVVADELYHDESYFVIGEQHQVSAGGGVHETTFILEPAIFDRMTYHARQNLNTGTALNGSDAKSCLTQGFQVAQDGDIGRIRLRLKKVGSPAGSLTLKLFSDKAYTDTWELGETGKSELGVFTKLLPDGGTSVPYDLETEATFVDAGSVSSGTTFTHTANCEIWYEADALAATDMRVIFRKQDSSNNWFVFIGSTGNLILFERIAGTANNRSSAAAGTVTAGAIIRIIASGSTIQAYVNGVLKINYASASNFATATNGEVTINGAGGVIKDLVAHRLAAAAVSELAEVSEHTDRLSGSVSAGTDFAHE
ncbi:MAG TPA: hypothetical protein VJZ27_06900, partial [Aggregatilineales bacterium]|nr:hypothetical protein [Aggregatilineales bacterium]